MERDCRVLVEPREDVEGKFVFCTKTNAALLVFTLFLVGLAAAVLLVKPGSERDQQQQDGHFDELRHSLRQTNVRDAIHLNGKYEETTRAVVWQQDTDQAFKQGELTLDNNEVVIARSGPYFVYSQASYRLSCTRDPEEDGQGGPVRLSHMVERWSDSFAPREEGEEREYRPILHSVRTACERHPQRQHWFSGVYVGAMFNLNIGDRLRTRLTDDPQILAQLEDGSGETFFGVFAL